MWANCCPTHSVLKTSRLELALESKGPVNKERFISSIMLSRLKLSIVAASTVFVVLACEESITAPGVCPDFCPLAFIEVVDTTLANSVERDSAFGGYAKAHDGFAMQVTSRDAAFQSRGIVEFLRFPDSILIGAATRPIVAVDSFRVRLELRGRDLKVPGLEVLIHRIPPGIDTNTTFDELTAFFDDSTIVGQITVNDTVSLDSLFVPLGPDAFPNIEADSFFTAVGISVRAPTPTYAEIATIESRLSATMTRYTKVDSLDGEINDHQDVRGARFDTFVIQTLTPPAGDFLSIGGTPATRSLLRLIVPPAILDSSEIVGAKLVLIPVEPALGAPGDSFRIQVDALSADFGPKSPLIANQGLDSAAILPGVLVGVGSMDPIEIDITDVLRGWQGDSSRPRSVMIRVNASLEGAVLGRVFVGSSRSPGAVPFLTVTYVPPFRFESQ